jgi:aspartate-semialdehyde dehydrogenase
MGIHVGVVGATGMVGEVFVRILEERKFPVASLKLFASDRSEGLKIHAIGKDWPVESLKPNCFAGLDVVFFSSGDDISKEWAPKAAAAGAFAIDNSAAFRMNSDYPLIVPEVNGHLIPNRESPTIIANPNCSTIQLVVALNALKQFGLEDVRVATYQSVSGAGKAGGEELIAQTSEQLVGAITTAPKTFTHTIAFNSVPQIGSFADNGFCSEEIKIINETRKILELPTLRVSSFTVRVPSLNAHSEAAWVTLKTDVTKTQIESALQNQAGLVYMAQNEPSKFPTSRFASGQDPVFLGRLHKDLANEKTWLMWIVADNILKGAALNGLQIAEKIFC